MKERICSATGVRGIVITGGFGPPIARVAGEIARAGYVVAADSGFDYATANGIKVDSLVGDLDSIKNTAALRNFPNDRITRVAHDAKDETDTEMGLRVLQELGYLDTVIIGGGGGRLDHLFGIFTLFDRDCSPLIWYTDEAVVYRIEGDIEFLCHKGERMSFFPVGNDACHMITNGLKWPLDSLQWIRGEAGISNEAISEIVRVQLSKGRLIVIGGYGVQEGNA